MKRDLRSWQTQKFFLIIFSYCETREEIFMHATIFFEIKIIFKYFKILNGKSIFLNGIFP